MVDKDRKYYIYDVYRFYEVKFRTRVLADSPQMAIESAEATRPLHEIRTDIEKKLHHAELADENVTHFCVTTDLPPDALFLEPDGETPLVMGKTKAERALELLSAIHEWLTQRGFIAGVHYDDASIIDDIEQIIGTPDYSGDYECEPEGPHVVREAADQAEFDQDEACGGCRDAPEF